MDKHRKEAHALLSTIQMHARSLGRIEVETTKAAHGWSDFAFALWQAERDRRMALLIEAFDAAVVKVGALYEAAEGLLGDIDGMYVGREEPSEVEDEGSSDAEEFFGPFSVTREPYVGGREVSWPNLKISADALREALKEVGGA